MGTERICRYPGGFDLQCSQYFLPPAETTWRLEKANVIKINRDINSHLRSISRTPILFKLAEDFVIERYVARAILEVIDSSQSGGIPRSRQQLKLLLTCYTLDQLVPLWVRRAVPVLLSDYRKAFDLIDHQILLSKIQIFLRCEIFHFALPDYLNADLEPVQKRVTSIIFPSLPMTNAYKNAVLFPFRIVAKMLVESCSTKSSTILSTNFRLCWPNEVRRNIIFGTAAFSTIQRPK